MEEYGDPVAQKCLEEREVPHNSVLQHFLSA